MEGFAYSLAVLLLNMSKGASSCNKNLPEDQGKNPMQHFLLSRPLCFNVVLKKSCVELIFA